MNGTSWGSIDAAFNAPSVLNADLVLAQEAHLPTKHACQDAEASLAKRGWKANVLQAAPTGGDKGSGGLVVAVPAKHGLALPFGRETLVLRRGRVSMHYFAGFCPGGALVVNAYMRVNQELQKVNWDRWLAIGELLVYFGLPFVLGGDLQIEPATLQATA